MMLLFHLLLLILHCSCSFLQKPEKEEGGEKKVKAI